MTAADAIGRVVEDYLAERQRLGYRMADTELRRFARYADARGHKGPLDAALQISWARLHVKCTTAGTATRRLETLRPFVRYYRQFEPGSAVMDPCLLGPKRGRLTPHIYTPGEINALVRAAARLNPSDALRPATYATLFGLLAVTGMRRSEAVNASALGSVFISLRRALRWRARGDCAEPRIHDLRHRFAVRRILR